MRFFFWLAVSPSESVFLSSGEILGSLRTYLMCRFHCVNLLLSPASHWQSNSLVRYSAIMPSHFFSAFLEQPPSPRPTRLCSFPCADKGNAQSDPTGWGSRILVFIHQNLQPHYLISRLPLSFLPSEQIMALPLLDPWTKLPAGCHKSLVHVSRVIFE